MKARADHNVGLVKTRKQLVEIGRIVLPIGVDLHQGLVALTLGIEKGGAHGPTNPNVEGQRDHRGPRARCYPGGVVGRAIIDYQNVRGRQVLLNLGDDVCDRALLIPGGDRDQCIAGAHRRPR